MTGLAYHYRKTSPFNYPRACTFNPYVTPMFLPFSLACLLYPLQLMQKFPANRSFGIVCTRLYRSSSKTGPATPPRPLRQAIKYRRVKWRHDYIANPFSPVPVLDNPHLLFSFFLFFFAPSLLPDKIACYNYVLVKKKEREKNFITSLAVTRSNEIARIRYFKM